MMDWSRRFLEVNLGPLYAAAVACIPVTWNLGIPACIQFLYRSQCTFDATTNGSLARLHLTLLQDSRSL
jgi:hypothetical protein